MTIQTDAPIIWARRTFHGAQRIGLDHSGRFILSLWTTPPPEPRGEYFTLLPISPTDYRRHYKTKAGYSAAPGELTVFDDWGSPHMIGAPQGVIDALAAECERHELPLKEPTP